MTESFGRRGQIRPVIVIQVCNAIPAGYGPVSARSGGDTFTSLHLFCGILTIFPGVEQPHHAIQRSRRILWLCTPSTWMNSASFGHVLPPSGQPCRQNRQVQRRYTTSCCPIAILKLRKTACDCFAQNHLMMLHICCNTATMAVQSNRSLFLFLAW